MTRTAARTSIAVAAIAGLVFLVLAAVLVPWSWVPGGHYVHLHPDDVFTADQIARGERYAGTQRRLSWTAYAIAAGLALVLGLTPLGAALARRVRGWWWWRVSLTSLALLLLGTLATLPWSWRLYANATAAGLSTRSASGWWRDQSVSFLVGWVPTALALVLLVGLVRRMPRRWPVVAAGCVAVLGALGSFVYPLVVEPLFNDFHPMQQGALRDQIMSLADREGVDVSEVLVADASRRTTTLNAYVSGFGVTRRVVVYDTLLDRAPRREVLLVVAHELGHARHRDVLVGTVLGMAGGVVGVGLLGLLLSSARLRRAAGAGRDPVELVPLVLALAVLGAFCASPIQNTISRAVEARADRASLSATGDVAGFVELQRRLAVTSRADPTPPQWSQRWFGTHPTALQRIGIAQALAPSLRSPYGPAKGSGG